MYQIPKLALALFALGNRCHSWEGTTKRAVFQHVHFVDSTLSLCASRQHLAAFHLDFRPIWK